MKFPRPLIVLLLAAAAAGCQRQPPPAAEAPAPKVEGAKISFPRDAAQLAALSVEDASSNGATQIQLFGRLVWNDELTVRVFTPYAGRVRKILVQSGQSVEKGAPLVEIESPDFGQAQADARTARSSLRLAQSNLARLRELFAHGAAAQKDVDAAEAENARAEAENARALAKLEVYGANADSAPEIFVLRSPLAGVVVERNVNPGQEIRPDQMLANAVEYFSPLFVISDPTRLWLQIDATEVDLPHLQPGREFTFSSRALPGQTWTGHVDHIAESIDPTTRTIKVRGTVNNASGLLKAEMFVSVNLPGETGPAVSVPSTAVFLKGEKHFVFVEQGPGEFARQEVAVGHEQSGRILVVDGLQAGQRVVTDGCILLEHLIEND